MDLEGDFIIQLQTSFPLVNTDNKRNFAGINQPYFVESREN